MVKLDIQTFSKDTAWVFSQYEYYRIPYSVVLHGKFKRITYHFSLSGYHKHNKSVGFWLERNK